jgi:abortive infection Abi-like protein
MPLIPPAVIGTVSPILANAYTHAQLNALFMSMGFPDDVPEGNKIEKCRVWLRNGNKTLAEPLEAFGRLIAEMMDVEHPPMSDYPWNDPNAEPLPDPRDQIRAMLAKEGLSYQRGGFILGAILTGPSKSLADRIKADGVQTIEIEYERAYKTLESDPAAAVTAACAILESVCKCYLEAEGQPLPNKQVLGQLWGAVADNLGLTPKVTADDDLKRVLQGLYSIADGVAALRTHVGSAHGHSPAKSYKLAPRHARLAVHAAHTMAMFVLETWEARKRAGD